jgi:DNA repair ATPase RecN
MTEVNNYQAKKETLLQLRSTVERQLGHRDALRGTLTANENKVMDLDLALALDTKVGQLLQLVSEYSQSQIGKVEEICSDALREILDDPDIEFKIKTDKKRNAVETRFYIQDKKSGLVDIMQGEAGAVKNIVSIGLRLIFLELYNPRIEGPVILDEVGGNISLDFQQSFGRFLKKFSDLTGRQIILISHHKPVIAEATNKILLNRIGDRSIIE